MTESISWRDVIELRREDTLVSSSVSKGVIDDAYRKMENFLDVFESTEMGQEKLRAIREKYSARENAEDGNMLLIRCQSGESSLTRLDGNIGINPEDSKYLAFIDQNTKQPQSFSLESILAHELMHAADPKFGFDRAKTPDLETVQEEHAVAETDRFARTYMPSLGIRGSSENKAGQTPDPLQDRQGVNGVLVLKVEEETVQEIHQAIQSVEERVRQAELRLQAEDAPQAQPPQFQRNSMPPSTPAIIPLG